MFGVVAILLDLLIASPLIVWLWRRMCSLAGPIVYGFFKVAGQEPAG